MSTQSKVAVVTGAGSGIGLAISKRLLEEGCHVVMADVQDCTDQAQSLSQLSEEKRIGVTAYPITADISDEHQVQMLFDEVDQKFGRLNILVNNAGIARYGSLDQLSVPDIDAVISTNLGGTILCSRAVLPLLRASSPSCIVNVASELGLVGAPNLQVYCATKGGIIQLTRAMAIEHATESIRVNCVCPGPVLTPLIERRIEAGDDPIATRREYDMVAAMERVGTPDEIANVVNFVASDEASFMTGSIIAVDGGATAK